MLGLFNYSYEIHYPAAIQKYNICDKIINTKLTKILIYACTKRIVHLVYIYYVNVYYVSKYVQYMGGDIIVVKRTI